MEYEAYEPDPNDEYYDQMCSAAYSTMFNEGSSTDSFESSDPSNQRPVTYAVVC